MFLSYSNSYVNPIIYAFLSSRFQKDVKKAFSCLQTGAKNKKNFKNIKDYNVRDGVKKQMARSEDTALKYVAGRSKKNRDLSMQLLDSKRSLIPE